MTKIKICAGQFTLEYEGEQEFIEEGLISLLSKIIKEIGPLPTAATMSTSIGVNANAPTPDVSTNTIAQIMDVKTGSDLALAAIAHLNLVQKKDRASRQEVLDEMRSASVYFKETYVSNLTSYLSTLVRNGRVNMVQRNTYALSATERRRIADALKQAEARGE